MKKDFWKKNGYGIFVAFALTAFTGYALLDTFLIPRPEVVAENSTSENAGTKSFVEKESKKANNVENESSETMAQEETSQKTVIEPVMTEDSYVDSNISITIGAYRVNNTDIYVGDISLASPEYLKTALANDTYGRNVTETTSRIAKANNAILAINGDYYGARNSGYVIRNGVLYRESSSGGEDLVIYGDGSFEIISEKDLSARELLEDGAVQVLNFGPALVVDGEISVTAKEEVGKAMVSNPRTAIGIMEENHYLFVVSDGRTNASEGLSLYELAEFMKELGAQTAYNLDGGGSSTMVFGGSVVNNPTTGGKRISERSVSDILYIGY